MRQRLLRRVPELRAGPLRSRGLLGCGFVRFAMLAECCDTSLEPIRAADLLKLSWNLAVAPPGVIAAIAADQLILAGVAVV